MSARRDGRASQGWARRRARQRRRAAAPPWSNTA